MLSTEGLAELKRFLVERYDQLKGQLTRRLGSSDLAGDALHDTWVRLAGKSEIEPVRQPQAFLLNAATNIAVDRLRVEARMLSESQVDDLFEVEDPAAGPAEALEARFELAALVGAMERLPARQREILFAVRLEGLSRDELAERYGISVRMVARELQAAHEFCVRQMRR
ncbi:MULTISPECIES: RNA polymerase sigma factor [Variovorax]|uniref:RNA polymerase sigma factor n=1 Tax=Variovorax TaxID=34072 RepID=UPI001F1F702E|nr:MULTISPECIES: sigma-70 family RNA polymerase sigma factor [Variovorax]UKI08011.1 sigma-70 family RNA polymerase sigma factor [Variovorax paradoxus]